MANLPLKTVDVFTAVPFKGNPVAVILDGSGLSTQRMQQVANWTNLSETTFVVPVTETGADYHVRIFTPGAELPFAGHPTIGTAHALLEAGMVNAKNGVLVQQCKAGLVPLSVTQAQGEPRWISFELPRQTYTPLDGEGTRELEAILDAKLDRAPILVDVGPRWVVAQLASAQAVLDSEPDLQRMKAQDSKHGYTGVIIFGTHDAGAPAAIEVRAFAPSIGVSEDPVCGSGNGALAAYLRHTGQAADFGPDLLASQGAKLGRAGILRLSIRDDAIRVGGNAVTCIDGHLSV